MGTPHPSSELTLKTSQPRQTPSSASFLQRRRRCREGKWHPQSHTACQDGSPVMSPGLCTFLLGASWWVGGGSSRTRREGGPQIPAHPKRALEAAANCLLTDRACCHPGGPSLTCQSLLPQCREPSMAGVDSSIRLSLGKVAATVTLPGVDWALTSCQAPGQALFPEIAHSTLRTSLGEVLSLSRSPRWGD